MCSYFFLAYFKFLFLRTFTLTFREFLGRSFFLSILFYLFYWSNFIILLTRFIWEESFRGTINLASILNVIIRRNVKIFDCRSWLHNWCFKTWSLYRITGFRCRIFFFFLFLIKGFELGHFNLLKNWCWALWNKLKWSY